MKGFIEWNLRTLTGTKNITPKARIIMSILQQKLKLPTDLVKIKKGDKVLFLNPNAPDWIVVSPNGAAILQLCNGRRTVENIAESLQKF